MSGTKKQTGNFENESPPLFRSWKSWYILVLVHLTFLIISFYLITKYFE
jgi:hypothetical protein